MRTLRPLKVPEFHSETKRKKQDTFELLIEKMWGKPESSSMTTMKEDAYNWEEYSDEDVIPINVLEKGDVVESSGRLLNKK